MKKKLMPVLVAAIFIIVVLLIVLSSALLKKYTPTKDRVDLDEYFNVSADDESDMAVILDNVILEEGCKYIDGRVYMPYELVNDKINQRFYWDYNENIMRYTTPDDVITVYAGSNEFSVSKKKESEEYIIVRVDGEQMYIALDFLEKYTNIDYVVHEEPNRVMITKQWGEYKSASLKKKTEIRSKGGIKSPIVTDLEKGTVVTVLEENETWNKVITSDGFIGYLKNNKLGEIQTEVKANEFEEPEFTHLLKDEPVSLAWHQVTTVEANAKVADVLKDTKSINVMSPTWFYLNDNEGNIKNLASIDYVNYCHQNGIEVWALISNLENPDASAKEVLSYTSKRDYLVNQIMSAAIEYDLDGINVDFESLSSDTGDSYVQFIRELSIKCRKNNIVLSVDNYVPTDYTAFYNRREQAVFADYIIIMAYDEHYRGSETEGPVASIGFVRDGAENTLKEVPAEQIILGMPFYTRVWELTPNDGIGDDVESASEDYKPYTLTCTEVGMQGAEDLYTANGAEKQWSKEAGQYYVEYENGGKTYKMWLEDEDSIEEKCKVMKENNLAGAAYWKIGLERKAVWDTIVKYIN